MMQDCTFCGSTFGDRKCYFCEQRCCTNCMTDDRTRCKQCYIHKRKLSPKQILKKNKIFFYLVRKLLKSAIFVRAFHCNVCFCIYVLIDKHTLPLVGRARGNTSSPRPRLSKQIHRSILSILPFAPSAPDWT